MDRWTHEVLPALMNKMVTLRVDSLTSSLSAKDFRFFHATQAGMIHKRPSPWVKWPILAYYVYFGVVLFDLFFPSRTSRASP